MKSKRSEIFVNGPLYLEWWNDPVSTHWVGERPVMAQGALWIEFIKTHSIGMIMKHQHDYLCLRWEHLWGFRDIPYTPRRVAKNITYSSSLEYGKRVLLEVELQPEVIVSGVHIFFTQGQFCMRDTDCQRACAKKMMVPFQTFHINYSLLTLRHIPHSLIRPVNVFTEIGMPNWLELSPGHLEIKGSEHCWKGS